MNNNLIKRLEESIETSIRKRNQNLKPDLLLELSSFLLKTPPFQNENSAQIESILLKLIQSGFKSIIKVFSYIFISNFNHELSSSFFSYIKSDILNDGIDFSSPDLSISALKNFINLNEKDIVENYSQLESIFKTSKFNINHIISSFYISNFPILIIDVFDKLHIEEYMLYASFLKKFLKELASLVISDKVDISSFLSLTCILSRLLNRFNSYNLILTKEKIVNSVLVSLAENLYFYLDEIINTLLSINIRLFNRNNMIFPINLYRIYIHYRDLSNPDMTYENITHKYIVGLFKIVNSIYEPELFSYLLNTVIEFKILDSAYNPDRYSTECYEIVSKFFDFIDNTDKGSWFDSNIKIVSRLINYIDYQDRIDLIFLLISEARFISNSYDRIVTLYNLFCSLIMINVSYPQFFYKQSLIHSLFIQNWFVILIQDTKPSEKDNRFRQDMFICLIESLFYAKKHILNSGLLENYIIIIKMCLDIIDVCIKIIDWADSGEIYKLYYLILEDTCLFFEDPFFCFLYHKTHKFTDLRQQLDSTIDLIAQRFMNKNWNLIDFSNENTKYSSILLLSQFLPLGKTSYNESIKDILYIRLNELVVEKSNIRFYEYLLKSMLFIYIRSNKLEKEEMLKRLTEFNRNILKRSEEEKKNSININIYFDIISYTENIITYFENNLNSPSFVINSHIVEEINNQFCLFIKIDFDKNKYNKALRYNNLHILNLTENSHSTMNLEASMLKTNIDNMFNPSIALDSFKRVYYHPLLEFNKESCHFLIENKYNFLFSQPKLLSGISDVVHIYYSYKLNLENKEAEVIIKTFNRIPIPIKSLIFNIGLNKNLEAHNSLSISQYSNIYSNYQQFSYEILPPFTWFEFSVPFKIKNFDKNEMTLNCSFEMITENSFTCDISSEAFHIKMTDFFIPDNFALYESKKFDIFFSSLDYGFTVKCFVDDNPEEFKKEINSNFIVIEFKYKSNSMDKSSETIGYLKEHNYKGYSVSRSEEREGNDGFIDGDHNENSKKRNFKMKISSYCVFNFWVYMLVTGDYNFTSNKTLLNIELRTNDFNALKILHTHSHVFLDELSNRIKYY